MIQILFDTNVVLDFWKADRHFFKRLSKEQVNASAASVITAELRKEFPSIPFRKILPEIGLTCVEVFQEDWNRVVDHCGLSEYDQIFMWMAKRLRVPLATNDRQLRSRCGDNGVEVLWGTDVLLRFYEWGIISGEYALQIGEIVCGPTRVKEHVRTKFLDDFQKLKFRLDRF